MPDDNKINNEVFVDADEGFTAEKDSYEQIILRQINDCVKTLSREMTGGQVITKEGKNGTEKYIEDVRELVINHIDTLRMLLCTYIKEDNKKQLDAIIEEIKTYKDKIGGQKIVVPGKGEVKLKDVKGLSADNPYWREFIHFKALKYRDIFEVLVNCYNNQRAYLKSLEEE